MLVQINGREGPGRPERGVGKFRARFSHAFCVAEWLIFEFKAVSRAFVSSWNEEEEIDAASWRTREYESVLRNYVALEFDRSMGKFNLSAGITVVCFLLGIAFGLNSKNSHFSPSTQAQESLDERSSPMVVLYVSEQCDHDFELDLMDIVVSMGLDRVMNDTKFYTVPKSVMCATNSSRTSTFLEMVKDPKSRFIVGSIEPSLCSVGQSLAQLHNITLVTWSCSEIHGDSLNLVNILPSKRTILNAIVNIVSTIRWRSISIITNSDENWWSDLAFRLGLALKKLNRTIIKNFILLNKQDTQESIERQLSKLKQTITSGVILCLPVYEEFTQRIIKMIDTRNFLEHPQSSLMMIDMFTGLPILSFNYSISSSLKLQRNGTDKNYHSYNQFAPSSPESSESNLSSQSERRSELHRNHSSQLPNSFFKNQSNAQKIAHPNEKLSMLHLGNSSRVKIEVAAAGPEDKQSLTSVKLNGNQTELNSNNSYFPLHRHSGYRVSKKMGDNLLVFTLSDYFFHRSSKNEMEYLFKSSLEVVKNSTKFIENQKFHFLLADVLNFSTNNPISRIAWRPVLDISCNFKNCTERNNSQFKTEFLIPNASSWIRQKSSWVYDGSVGDMCDDFTSCPDDDDELMFDEQYGTLVMGVLLTSAIFIGLLFVCCFVRRQYLKSKTAKGPVKILLTPADFVFPQVQDTGGVDSGIESMLCCWLTQLQEFGGPSMKEKPDLLKGSVLSLKSQQTQQQRKNSTSSLSLSRPFVIDSRARYNGDLVQLKELPMQGGNFELKSKAMDILVSLHGLRHENLNPLIGCLTDPARPALVWEWCSRGSLEDVLIQDEIKLDWTFRLSLLTDLVRGMRYLHTCPYRVHGALTSRNCVIDARWVLKITDYSLTTFYEAQNITSPEKSARDLLWTAPELLRSPMNAKRGTQSGDVYSFAIIMQEVVVRGEPFCMLSLTPEDIIEKVKRPPPLIRPSVSKGAAPPEAINIMRQCWAEQPDKRPDFNGIFDLFKTLNHGRKANFVDTMFQMLEKYSNNLEDLIRDRTEQLDMEKKKTEQLLNRMLPSTVAEKLKLGMPVDPEDFEEVTIYFSDIVGFTTISAYSTPFEVVDLLNDLYTCFDATINAYNVYKVETIGDAYMVVGGLPVRIPDHADQIATMALHLLHQSGKFKIRHLPFTPLRLRIGLHTGPCCAGVVGLTMPRYCLFGDTVNTASRLESTGAAWRIHLSQATKEKLDQVGEYEIQYRGETELKGKGKMPTYWLLGKTGFNKELPVPPLLEESHGLDENLIRYGRTGLYETGVSSIEGLRPQIGPRESEESGSVDLSIEFSASQTSPPTTTTSQTTRQSLEAIAAQKILKNQFSLDARLGVGVPLHGGSIRAGTKLEKHRTFDAHLITVTNRDDDEEVSDSTTHAENDLGNVSGVSLNVTNLLRVHSSGLSTPFSISDTEFDLQYIDQASSSASSNTSRNQLEPPTVATISKPHQATENDRSCPQKSPLLRPNLKQNIENPFISITNREYPVISAEEKSKLIEMSRVPEPKDRDSLKTVQDTSLSNNINSFATCINNSNNSNSHSISNNNNINNSSNTFNNNSSRAGLDNVIVQNVHAEPASTCIPGSNNSINNNDCSKIGESSNYKTDNAISSIFRVVNPQKHKQDYDISTPYSHYRCLSPMSETSTEAASHRLSVGMGRLKRQFSVDKTDEIGVVEGLCLSTTGLKTSTGGNQQSSSGNRLFKQNSAGAASDLERIAEEAAAAGASGLPATGNKFTSKDDYYKHRLNVPSLKSISASSESLH